MDISLIKQLNESIREKDDYEKALEEAGIEFDLGDEGSEEMDFQNGGDDELSRIADHWREQGADMDDDQLRDAIGDDLEQLEYSPEEISTGIDKVMDMLERGTPGDEEDFEDDEGMDDEYDEPDVDERQEMEDFEQADEYFGGGDERM